MTGNDTEHSDAQYPGAQHPDNLRAFVNGELDQIQIDVVMAHLAECDVCLAEVDALWAAQAQMALSNPVPALDETTARRVEKRLLNQLHRSDFGGRALWLGTAGFINTIFALLRPLINSNRSVSKRKGSSS